MKKLLTAVTASAIVLSQFAVSAKAVASQNGSAWPDFLADPTHSSYSTDSQITASSAMGVKWMTNIYNTAMGSPVVAYNAALGKTVVYVGTNRADFFAIDAATGAILWSTNLGVNDKIEDSPLVAPDGSVWVGTSDNPAMYKLDGATGAIQCSEKAPLAVDASPVYGIPAGGSPSIYWATIDTSTTLGPVIGTSESNCSSEWNFLNYVNPTSGGAWATPAFGTSATGEPLVFVGTADGDSTEYAIDAVTGNRAWAYSVTNPPPGLFDIGDAATVSPPGNNGFADGVVYVDSKYGYEYALDMTNGSLLWQFHIAPGAKGSSSRSSAALDGTNLVFGYGAASGFGGGGGVYALNAVTAEPIWQWVNPNNTEVLSSPAIVGPPGSEVVAFGDIAGTFHTLSLSSGTPLYSYKTGGYITSSAAEALGQIYIASSDGFLYAFGPGGGNAPAPATSESSPANLASVANPNGTLTITGSAQDGSGVAAVQVAVQMNGASGPWYNAATGSFGPAPISNPATLSTPGSGSTTWSFTLPVPPSGGNYSVFSNAINTSNIANKATMASFTVGHSNSSPNVRLSLSNVAPGATLMARASGFNAGEQVAFSLFGSTVATATATSTGAVTNTKINVPTSATFGPTSVTAVGQTSGKASSATLFITNNWSQGGHDAGRTSYEPNDSMISRSISVGNNTVLNQSWYYAAGAPVNSQASVVNGIAYFGDDAGTLTAAVTNTGAPSWKYTIGTQAAIRTAPAVDSTGNIVFGAADGNLYTLTAGGVLLRTLQLGGNLTAVAIGAGQQFVSSDGGRLYGLSDATGSVQWSSALSGAGHSAPAYDSVKKVVVAGDDGGAITAFNAATGAQVWRVATGGAVTAAPMITNGTVYVGSADSYLYSINELTGSINWKYKTSGAIVGNAAKYGGNSISVGDSNGIAYLLTASGTPTYQMDTHTKSPIVGISTVAGNAFFAMANGVVGMIRLDGPVPFGWSFQTKGTLSTAPTIVDGTVYIAAADGGLYAFTPQGANPMLRVNGATISVSDTTNDWDCNTSP